MVENFLVPTLLLLAATVVVVLAFRRLQLPTSLGYLLVGVLFSAHTPGPVIDAQPVRALAEFGIVFLLFTVGLNYSIPQIQALRNTVLSLGTAQVAGTTVIVGLLAYFVLDLPAATAFVIGAVFAQSSTTVISNQLIAQGEDNSRHGRLGVAMSVFQDVTAVPLLILIPVFGAASMGFTGVLTDIGLALAKAVFAFFAVFYAGRWLLRPMFHLVAEQRSAEVFTLTVLLVSLAAGWATSMLGLSMAFGAFLAGMMLGETEFRHQVESTIRPFRDVLLGLFFIGVGMLIDPLALPAIWPWVVLGTLVLLLSKILLVAAIVRGSGVETLTAWRTALLLAVGGEFGFALLSISLADGAIDAHSGQIVLYSVLLSIIVAPFLIRHNHEIAARLAPRRAPAMDGPVPLASEAANAASRDHVIICGYGRIGQGVAHMLEEEGFAYVALDLDPARVRDAHTAGEPVFYGDATERDVLLAAGIESARLVVISHEDVPAALKVLHHARALRPGLPVMVRTRDERHVEELRAAGAAEVVAETLEASLMIAVHTLVLLGAPAARVMDRVRSQRNTRYRLLGELYRGDSRLTEAPHPDADRLQPVVLVAGSPAVGCTLGALGLDGVAVTALVRQGRRRLAPPPDTCLAAGDVVVVFGSPEELQRASRALLG